MGDDSEEEVNLGLGYRYLIPDTKAIVGANMYYDSHWSEHGNQFDQLGFGLELLTEFIDGRVNYYLPENDSEPISSAPAKWGSPFAQGNSVLQEYWGLVEKPREGYDAEVGFKIPKIDKFAEVRVFAGYYDFESEFSGGSDLDGVKGRLEVRPCSALTFDAEVYEDKDLLGTDYFVGVRMHVPFNLGNLFAGGNPFEGAAEAFRKQPERPFAQRMTEQVIRDQYIRLESGVGGPTRTTTIADDVVFVNSDTGTPGSAGTKEDPLDEIQAGADAADAAGMENVFVENGGTPYMENVVLADEVSLWGSAMVNGGFTYGPTEPNELPTVDGNSAGPAITLGTESIVSGMHVTNSGTGVGTTTDPIKGYDTTRVGIYGGNVTDNEILNNWIEGNSYGVLLTADSVAAFDVMVEDNVIEDNDEDGLAIETSGASGSFYAGITGTYLDNSANGVDVDADNYDTATVDLYDLVADSNDEFGVSVDVTGGSSTINAQRVQTNDNDDGIDLQSYADGTGGNAVVNMLDCTATGNDDDNIDKVGAESDIGNATVNMHNITADNGSSGAGIQDVYAYTAGTGMTAAINMQNISANRNYYAGIEEVEAYSDDGPASVAMDSVTANENEDEGIDYVEAYAYGTDADATINMTNITANNNGYDGIDTVEAEANGDGADAVVSLNTVTADYNNDEGIDSIYAYSNGLDGDATVNLVDVGASYNDDEGIEDIQAETTEGDSTVNLTNVVANYNDDDGIEDIEAYAYGDGNNAVISLNNVTVLNNEYSGIYSIDAEANGAGGNATINADMVTASNNNDYGIEYNEADAYGAGGVATVNASNITANANQDENIYEISAGADDGSAFANVMNVTANDSLSSYGIEYIEADADDATGQGGDAGVVIDGIWANNNYYENIYEVSAYSEVGNATVDMQNVTANNSREDEGIGYIEADTDGAGTSAIITLDNITANDNDEDGIYSVDADAADGSAIVSANNITSTGNSDDGIDTMEANAANTAGNGGDAMVSYTNSTTMDNDGVGAYLYSNSANGTASIFGEKNTVSDNCCDGIEVEATSGVGNTDVDFGGGTQGSLGLNSLFGNDGFDFINSGSGTAFVEESWWGADTDPVANGQTSGTVDVDPWLAAEPE